MRGEYHLTLSLLIGWTLYYPFLSLGTHRLLPLIVSLLLLLFLSIGSLVPDVDASDSKLFYEYPTAGHIFKYGIYYPLSFFFKERKHRGFMHSLEGAFLTTLIFMSYVFVISVFGLLALLLFLPTIESSFLNSIQSIELVPIDIVYGCSVGMAIGLGLFTGILLHIFEDSLTISGVNWKWSGTSNWYRNGNIRVGGTFETGIYTVFFAESGLCFIYEYITPDILVQTLRGSGALVLVLLTGFFSQTPYFTQLMTSFSKTDIQERDITIRNKAKDTKKEIILGKDLVIYADEGRITRGLEISKKEIDKRNKRVEKYRIKEIQSPDGSQYTCTCKDFKVVGDIVYCKHIIAYLRILDKKYETELEKAIN